MTDNVTNTEKENNSGFFWGVIGIFRTPGRTLSAQMSTRKWGAVFLLLAAVVSLYSYVAYPVQVAKMSEQAEMNGYMSADEVARYFNPTGFSRIMASAFAVLSIWLVLVFGAFFLYLFFGIGGAEGNFGNFYALVVNASVIDLMLPLLLNFLVLLTGVNFGYLASPLMVLSPDPKTLTALVLERFNVFFIWYLIAVAAGVSVYAKLDFKKCLRISLYYFLFKSLIGIAFAYLLIKMNFAPFG